MRKPKRPEIPRVLGYIRVSTHEQAESGASPEAQTAAIGKAAAINGWEISEIIADNGTSGAIAPDSRIGLSRALAMLDGGQADMLVASKIDRVSRSVLDFVTLVDRAERNGWQLVTLDVQVDTSTPVGEAMRGMLAVFAQLERRFISQRTKEGLAVKRSQGVTLGRPVQIPADVAARIRQLREEMLTWQAIADTLNADGVPTARGGQWKWSTVRDVHARLLRADAERS